MLDFPENLPNFNTGGKRMISKKKNIAGEMGAKASQPAKRRQTVDPLERANQKMEGRMKGGDPRKAKRRSMMNSYGMS